jgi:23S rRNA pseudouridine2605 synthase
MNPDNKDSIRLNKHLALQLGLSRREADDYIAQKRVSVNGSIAELGSRIAEGDTVTIDDTPVTDNTAFIYLALNKPTGYVCSRRQQGESPTIYSLLPTEYQTLKPVGRLDRNSSGIILLTNDGDFAYQMTHPKFAKTKLYNVQLDHDLEPLHQQMISDYGVQLEDGTSTLGLERLNDTDRKRWIVTMKEGRNRQIRRTFGSLGYSVEKLHRTNFGNYTVGDIKPGSYEIITIQ